LAGTRLFVPLAISVVVVVVVTVSGATTASSATAATVNFATPPGGGMPQLGIPLPPGTSGCYNYTPTVGSSKSSSEGWQRIPCDSPQYVATHLKRPEVLPGEFDGTGNVAGNTAKVPFVASTVRVTNGEPKPAPFSANEIFDSDQGQGYFSIQDNVFFESSVGGGSGIYGDQFTDQVNCDSNCNGPAADQVWSPNVCLWQVDIPNQNYNSTCTTLTLSGSFDTLLVEGALLNGQLYAVVPKVGGGAIGVESSDQYGLTDANRWSNDSGSLLGWGNGSQASFNSAQAQLYTRVDVASCLAQVPGLALAGGNPCTNGNKLTKKLGEGPGVVFGGTAPVCLPGTGKCYNTVETNDLKPVNSKPGTWYDNYWDADTEYTSTLNGKCVTGTYPLCDV